MEINWNSTDSFASRHIGASEQEVAEMLKCVKAESLEQLIAQTIPAQIRLSGELNVDEAISERKLLDRLKHLAQQNKVCKSYIGLGYYNCVTPAVIQRNVFENPGWYTQYTPYQAEISQGRLEALLNFQTMVCDLTGMKVANASLLDEGTAAAEAMTMFNRLKPKKSSAFKFFVASDCFPQTIDVLKAKAEPLGIELVIADSEQMDFSSDYFGALLQYPNVHGGVTSHQEFIAKAHEQDILVAVASDLMALTLLTPPGEWGADVVLGNSQNFGVPLGYGGPHAAFFACREKFYRQIPGRLVGVSKDRHGNFAYRLALQTREQHIRRDKATSNICTAQALLAVMASMYAVYHGPQGLEKIARRIHGLTAVLAGELEKLNWQRVNREFFNTVTLIASAKELKRVREIAQQREINFGFLTPEKCIVALDETTTPQDVEEIVAIFAAAKDAPAPSIAWQSFASYPCAFLPQLQRTSSFLDHRVFHSYHTETEMLRYLKRLENRDLSLTSSMIPLGSCTMKLNAAAEMIPVSLPGFAQIHPFAPKEQTLGYQEIFRELEKDLCEITGFAGASLQPNSGAQGEYAGLMVIRKYHHDRGETQRNIALIPSSAHGTNPASAVLAGMKVVIVKCNKTGDIDLEDLTKKAQKYQDTLAALMITYPSTHGVFEEKVQEICQVIHEHGGQVFMDGANMNAQVGLTNPAIIGTDVCHLNLHKTFSIPHGGGGPGMGPICVAKHLVPYLPRHSYAQVGGDKGIAAVSSAPWGSASILLISYAYIKMLGKSGMIAASKQSILSANYLKARLEEHYQLLFSGSQGRVAHEMIMDFRPFKKAGISVEDVAKRLIDYGFHAPTMSWPVPETMMIEPTESESKAELDRFCEAMIAIRAEIEELANGQVDAEDNPLKNAPHTIEEATSDNWSHSYSRERAVYPLSYLRRGKFWSSVGRIDNVYGDRNVVCTCPAVSEYEQEQQVVSP